MFDLFGLPRDAAVTRADAVAFYCDESREAMELLRAYAIKHRRGFTMDARLAGADGQSRWMRLTTALTCEEGRPRRLYGTKQDFTFEYDRREGLKGAEGVDALTALATRAAFEARFLHARGKQHPEVGMLLVIDLAEVEAIRRRFGTEARDACLCALASRIAYRAHDALMIARLSDHAFAVVLPPSSGRSALARRAQRLLRDLRQPIYWQGYLLRLTPSAGVARPADACAFDAEELFSAACAKTNAARRGLAWIGSEPESLSLCAERRGWTTLHKI